MKTFTGLSDFAKTLLISGGWKKSPDLESDVEIWRQKLCGMNGGFTIFAEAERVLLEFGKIKIIQSGEGLNQARESIEINPMLCLGEDDRFHAFEIILGQKLFPIGEHAGGHSFLAIGENGKTYSLMMDIFLIGNSFEEALENLIRGYRIRRLPERDQTQ